MLYPLFPRLSVVELWSNLRPAVVKTAGRLSFGLHSGIITPPKVSVLPIKTAGKDYHA